MRKIFLITERRADYSRFQPILKLLEEDPDLDYDLVVTGLHLKKEHGYTIKEIEDDKLSLNKSILFTGTLQKMSRDRAKELAKKKGYKIASNVSKNLYMLVFGEKSGSKLKKAKDLSYVEKPPVEIVVKLCDIASNGVIPNM